jgi:3,4-dihydroxy 2-butanone 4-phosphate synthase / GTP cyclohydrolase II
MTQSDDILTLDPFSEVIAAVKAGQMIIMIDDSDREDEGDLVIATECIKSADIAFMMDHARGLICVSISQSIAHALQLPPQVSENGSPFLTPFTVSIDHYSVVDRGCEASSRVTTMQRLISSDANIAEFSRPGYVFPLTANPAGVLGRRGQTEGSYDLARLAGLKPSGVICEILNDDGSMARGAQLRAFADRFGLLITSVEEVVKYRLAHEPLVRVTAQQMLATQYGMFRTTVFQDDRESKEHLALVYGDGTLAPNVSLPPLVRIHSECLTGDVFGSRRCDCGPQLDYALQRIQEEGKGIVLYLRQEGRGIGLDNKIRAYALQDAGHDTVEANELLGFEADKRDFASAAAILHQLGLTRVRLLTNNPRKVQALVARGIEVTERVPIVIKPDEESLFYLNTKRIKLGHLLDIDT